jgi:uncharacterized protein (DUF2141 family)
VKSDKRYFRLFALLLAVFAVAGCARMGSPDGGWYDEKPPVVMHTSPANGAVGVNQKRVTIYFDEFVTLDNATENVIISPPQTEQPDIKVKGKSIVVNFKDSLKEATTYTVDFSDAIKDNNEGNPLGNYTFTFSTGGAIDTMQVGGYVLDAETLEPVQGTQVGLYLLDDSAEADTTIVRRFTTEPMLRVSRTDQSGHFTIKGVKPGRYRIYALKDVDNNFMLTPGSGEQMAFLDETIVPSVFDDTRQDTTMLDSLRIKSIERVRYKHFMPDNVILRAFTEPRTDRSFIKNERLEPEKFTLYFSYGDSLLPQIRGLNFDIDGKYILEQSQKNDTLTYWLTDTAHVNTDSLEIEMTYRMTDSLGVLQPQTDTLMLLPKVSYEKRLKERKKELETWEKQQAKRKKRGEPYDSIKAPDPLKVNIVAQSKFDPDKTITVEFPTPMAKVDTSMVHLYVERDSTWYNADCVVRNKPNGNNRTLEIVSKWEPGLQYSFETDSAAFVDIYGKVSKKEKFGFKVKALEEYGTFQMNIPSLAGQNLVCQLYDSSDKLVKEVKTSNGIAKFMYLDEKEYFLRVIVDTNGNGIWDTGKFETMLQPEQVYYYNKPINCRAKWDITEIWNPSGTSLNRQKPSKLMKTKTSEKRRTQQNKNAKRAQEKGIELPEYLK